MLRQPPRATWPILATSKLASHLATSHWIWVALALVVLLLDYASGPLIQFPILFILPVSLAAWNRSSRWALGFAVALPVINSGLAWSEAAPWSLFVIGVNATVRAMVFLVVAILVGRARTVADLRDEIQTLRGILPICSFCKKIRNDRNEWEPLEMYIAHRSEAQFSHGVCEACAKREYGYDPGRE